MAAGDVADHVEHRPQLVELKMFASESSAARVKPYAVSATTTSLL